MSVASAPEPRPCALFVRGGALGDLVVSLPVLQALIDAGYAVDVAVRPRYAPLLPAGVARVLDVGGVELLWLHTGARPPAGLGPWSLALAFSPAIGAALTTIGVPEVRVAPPIGPGRPASAQLAEILAGRAAVSSAPRIVAPALGVERAVLIGPGAGAAGKRWPLARWWAVAEGLQARGLGPVRFVRGPEEAEEPGWPERTGESERGGLGTIAPDLARLAGWAARARAWLGPDSGPAHVAAAVGAPVGVLFGPTDSGVWAPPGARVFGMDDPPERWVDWVAETVRADPG